MSEGGDRWPGKWVPSIVVGARVEVPRKQRVFTTTLMRVVRADLTEDAWCVLGVEGKSWRSGLPPLPPVCDPAGL